MSTKDSIFQRTEAGLKALLAPALVTTPVVRPNPALLAGRASVDAFADKMLANERALEQAAISAMLREAFASAPGFSASEPNIKVHNIEYTLSRHDTPQIWITDFDAIVEGTLILTKDELHDLSAELHETCNDEATRQVRVKLAKESHV